ncbi:(2Fe-2S)-binding protein [Muricoccus radiodurans]|uniref:(2Fe-2S)-binding protein n=1 Tax=Muricoccus radiodurans TaxID=2231721 RepID=UPI003CE6FEF0
MFRRTEPTDCTIEWDGRAIPARAGEPLAAALLAAGITQFRDTAVSRTPRGPLCLMGACYDCLVEVEGEANVQACMVTVKDGLHAAPQRGPRSLEMIEESAP